MAYSAIELPPGVDPGLEETHFFEPSNFTFPFGAHVALVEVDPATGEVKILRYVAVDDVGNIINPLLVKGQIHGGIAQGAGQALNEEVLYDSGGQPINASLMHYALPKSNLLPRLELENTVTPTDVNPLGAKRRRRVGNHRLHPGRGERRHRRSLSLRRSPSRHAGAAGANLARVCRKGGLR